jgi:hypothetical protein
MGMTRAASMISLLSLWFLAAGCGSQSTQARIHVRVFEVPPQVLRLHTSEQKPYKLADSAYSVSAITPRELDAMLRSEGAKSPLLAERTRVINDWPAVMDTWVYSSVSAGMRLDTVCNGGGVGSLGVRGRGRNLEIRLDYMVNHRGPQGQKLIESKIYYDYLYPEGQVLLFHAPSHGPDGRPRLHVIAFDVTREDQTSLRADVSAPRQPSNILAYR